MFQHKRVPSKAVKLFAIFGILGPIFYLALVTILGFMWKGYNPVSTDMSEIGAVDSPFQNIMNYLGFSLLGISIIVFSFGFKSYFKKDLQTEIAFILLFIGGFFMFLVGFFPCDPQCIDVTLTGKLHSITSTIPAILIPVAAIISAYPISKEWGKRFVYSSFCLGGTSIIAGPIMFIESLFNYTGLIQRFGIGLSLFWIMIVTYRIYNET